MPYLNLTLGIIISTVFVWLLVRNSKRNDFVHALSRVDTILGIAAGIYLTITSIVFLLT